MQFAFVGADSGVEPEDNVRHRSRRRRRSEITSVQTFTQLSEDQELGLARVRLLLTDGGGGAELDRVGMAREFFLHRRVRETQHKPDLGSA